MWPSSAFARPFGNVPCPSGAGCELPYCIFSHKVTGPGVPHAGAAPVSTTPDGEPAAKRVKLDHDTTPPVRSVRESSDQVAEPQVFVGSIAKKPLSSPSRQEGKDNPFPKHVSPNGKSQRTLPRTVTRPVSPPPGKTDAEFPATPEAEVRLIPRKLQKEPTTFARRLTYLQSLHKFMTPLNDKVARAVRPETKALHLNKNELNVLVLDEEQRAAVENASVYDNVLKQRLFALKKMTIEEWVKSRREAVAKEKSSPSKKPPAKRVTTGLTAKEEVVFLSTLTAPPESLRAHGFVTEKPTEADLNETHAAQISADFWEECDRCGSRFQVFPDRREEDGALTTGGRCQHHWGKRIFGRKAKGQPPEPTRFSCCNEIVGSPGCVTHDTHVYKLSDAKRMSLFMPFIETPENDNVDCNTAVCFDCEMGYTTHGLELLRLTVVSWPSHRPLVDVLVRPLGHMLDVNTRFSGVTAEQFLHAKPYDPANPKPLRKDLRIVDSPYDARSLFLAHVSPTTPVLGHALENDLNVIRLIHPTIVDTVILYPTKNGLPYRHGLRNLAKWHLEMDIQQGGAAGHDSYEDARTTGELIRFKIAESWKKMKDEGWTIRDDGVYPPIPEDLPLSDAPPAPSMIGAPRPVLLASKAAEKRKLEQDQDQEDGGECGNSGEEPPAKRQE